MLGVVVLPLLGLVAPTLTLVTPFRYLPHHGSAAVMQETLEAAPLAPGVAEDSVFITDASVKIWKEFQRDGPADAAENLREVAAIASRIATQGADGLTYALAHGLRTGYFAFNAALGTLAFELNDRLRGDGSSNSEGASVGTIAGFGNAMSSIGGLGIDGAVASRLLLEAAMVYEQDFGAIRSGVYKAPWDMTTRGHRQLTPQFAARQTVRFVNEAVATLGRRASRAPPSKGWMGTAPGLYPEYYRNDFHYQTDGWMSTRSASVYETSTETLFVGRQDAMQRLSLRPLRDATSGRADGKLRILEVAAGTGRVATFIRDNYPEAELTVTDLSPFYLEAARENDGYWRQARFPNKETRPPPATFVQAAAEALPFEAGAFDAVVCVYLFHELPETARAAAAAEMARVVRPGGVVVLTDSMQRGDRPALDGRLSNFAKLNEPHYENYIDCYLPALFEARGLLCDRKWVSSSSKCLSFKKPTADADVVAVEVV